MRGNPHFSFWIPITLAKFYFSPIVITFAKIERKILSNALLIQSVTPLKPAAYFKFY